MTPQALHDWYRLHVLDVRSAPEWERRWFMFLKQGYTAEDLKLLIYYLRREIKHGRRNDGALLLRNLLDLGPDNTFLRLDEDLALARAKYQPRPAPPAVAPAPQAPRPVASQQQLDVWARTLRDTVGKTRGIL